MTDEIDTESTPAEGGDSPPPWATRLQAAIEELPKKLRATVTDDDKGGIAEAVHGLFERSGAFQPATDSPESTEAGTDDGKDTSGDGDQAPEKPEGKWAGFAARHFGGA